MQSVPDGVTGLRSLGSDEPPDVTDHPSLT
jgi:hypothetical protein